MIECPQPDLNIEFQQASLSPTRLEQFKQCKLCCSRIGLNIGIRQTSNVLNLTWTLSTCKLANVPNQTWKFAHCNLIIAPNLSRIHYGNQTATNSYHLGKQDFAIRWLIINQSITFTSQVESIIIIIIISILVSSHQCRKSQVVSLCAMNAAKVSSVLRSLVHPWLLSFPHFFLPHYTLLLSLICSRTSRAQRLSRNLAVRKHTPILPPHSPAFDGNNNNDPRHQERNHAHRDGEDEHCVQAIGFHCFGEISCLKSDH